MDTKILNKITIYDMLKNRRKTKTTTKIKTSTIKTSTIKTSKVQFNGLWLQRLPQKCQ